MGDTDTDGTDNTTIWLRKPTHRRLRKLKYVLSVEGDCVVTYDDVLLLALDAYDRERKGGKS